MAGCDSSDVSGTGGRLTGEGVFFGNYVDVDGERVIVATRAGSAYVFERTGGGWEQRAEFDDLGVEAPGAVALSGDYAFVGAADDLDNQGAVHIFEREDESYARQDVFRAERETGNQLGRDLAVHDGRLIVGAANKEIEGQRNAGAAYVLELNGSDEWMQTAKLTASSPKLRAGFGFSVDLTESNAIVGAIGENALREGAGAAYVFQRDSEGGGWMQTARLTASDAAPRAGFGESVAIGEGFALASSSADAVQGTQSAGTIYAYERVADGWTERQKINSQRSIDQQGHFGAVVDLSPSGDYLISQSIFEDEGRGAAYVFHRRADGQWQQQARLIAPERRGSAFFGEDVAITDRYAVVGAPGENEEQGAVYVFGRSETNWTPAR